MKHDEVSNTPPPKPFSPFKNLARQRRDQVHPLHYFVDPGQGFRYGYNCLANPLYYLKSSENPFAQASPNCLKVSGVRGFFHLYPTIRVRVVVSPPVLVLLSWPPSLSTSAVHHLVLFVCVLVRLDRMPLSRLGEPYVLKERRRIFLSLHYLNLPSRMKEVLKAEFCKYMEV